MKTLSKLAVGEDGFVFDRSTGHTFYVSPTHLTILRGLIDEQSDAFIVEQLALNYDVNIDAALRDVSEFRGVLRSSGLL